MLHKRVNGYEMAYIEVGTGAPLVLVHGSLCDFRIWSPVLGPLSRHCRVIAPSLRHYFPEHWDGSGRDFTVDQHVRDTISFLEQTGGASDLVGHSRGGHIAFRVAEQRPDLVRRLILAEPGGDLDGSLAPARDDRPSPSRLMVATAVEKIAAGDVEGGVGSFVDAVNGPGAWLRLPAAAQQETRDNAYTLLGQINEARRPYARAEAEAIRAPTLFVSGEKTTGVLPVISRALAAHIAGARSATIPDVTHMMFVQDPVRFCALVLDFLRSL